MPNADPFILYLYAALAKKERRFIPVSSPGGDRQRWKSEARSLCNPRSGTAAAAGLVWGERRGFGLHYAETLRRWRDAFDNAEEEGRLPAGFDPAFARLWRYYLMYCEGGFRGGGIDVHQVTLFKSA